MPLYEQKGKEGQLVPMTGEVPQEALLAIERADEGAIIRSLTGEFGAENFMYSYPIKGGQVYGIGTDGAKEIARMTGNLEVLPDVKFDKDSDPDYIYAMVRARNLVNNVTLLGVGRQCKYYLSEGNIPTDRINEYAFVIAVSKAQRNVILSLANQETIAKIVQTFVDHKKTKQAPPAYGKSTTTAKAKPAKAEDTLKKLRQQVAIEWDKTGKSDDERKEWQGKEYGVESMTELDADQLNDMLAKIKDMQPDLGFSSPAEQNQMRKQLFSLLTEIGYDTDDKKKEYLAKKKITHTGRLTRDELEKLIQEVQGEKKIVDEAESIPEDI